ncbi:helix-turn-helix domain-containing protein [Novosphingobium aquiterrae]|uniref:Helix-turn-helix domain-containing protein n=1 Tax=Novosphingobium aquiterrae TaxID=624388 RepID=A0ABV6PLC6_9SPHN
MKIILVDSQNAALAPWLMGYLGAELNAGDRPVRRVIPVRPNCFVQIILGGDHLMIDVESGERVPAPRVGLFGPLSHYRYDMEISGPFRTFSARFQPAAAGQLFGVDPVAMVNRVMAIGLPSGLYDALDTAPDWGAMAELADRWIAMLCEGRFGEDPVARAARMLREAQGQLGIKELCEESGLSMRHFQRRFRQLTGQNPKHYARVCRVSHAVHMKELQPDLSWTAAAFEAGYSDQSHFIRDFKGLTGILPRDFLRFQTPIERYPRWRG